MWPIEILGCCVITRSPSSIRPFQNGAFRDRSQNVLVSQKRYYVIDWDFGMCDNSLTFVYPFLPEWHRVVIPHSVSSRMAPFRDRLQQVLVTQERCYMTDRKFGMCDNSLTFVYPSLPEWRVLWSIANRIGILRALLCDRLRFWDVL